MNELTISEPRPDNRAEAAPEQPGNKAMSLRLRRFLVFLRRLWWIPCLTLLLGIGGAAAYYHWKAPTFVSTARMFETVKIRLPEGGLFSEDVQNFLGTQTELLQSTALRELALERLRATTNSVSIPLDETGRPLPVDIRVYGGAKSSVFSILASSANLTFTRDYLNALMDAYLNYKRNLRQVISGDTLASISEQVQRYERDLKNEQDALSAFQRTNNLAVLEQEGAISGSYLTQLKTRLSDLQLEARLLNATRNDPQLTQTGVTNTLAVATELLNGQVSSSSSNAGDRQSVFNDLELLKLQRERLSQNLRPKHPKMVSLNQQIERAERLQGIYREKGRDALEAAWQVNQLRTENVAASITEWEHKVAASNRLIAEAARIKVNIERIQNVYDRLQGLVQNVGISRNIDRENLAILERASEPRRSWSEEKSALRLAIVGGLAVGMGIVFLVSVRDDRFVSVNEIQSKFGDGVIGLLPEVPAAADSFIPLLELNDSRHMYAEAYRSLRSALLFAPTHGERPKVVLVTSSMPNEGKSTVSINLARTLAMSGSRVLLVDGDLRRGSIHRRMNLPAEPGLAEVLDGGCSMEGALQSNVTPNLSFLARGRNSGHPGDLFLASCLDPLLARWRQEYDFVIIDSSPLFAADDVSCLAPKVDGTLFVVRRNQSGARAASEALEVLVWRQARILGVVFNGADASSRSYQYYKYAEYYSGAISA